MSRSVTLKGKSFALQGTELKVGDIAPAVTLRKNLVEDFSLADVSGKPRVYSVVPSLDTPVCAVQTRRIDEESQSLSNITWFTISCDLPVAMSRFCGVENIDSDRIKMLSDHKDLEFGNAFGTLIPELRVLCRAVFVIDKNDRICFVEYVSEISNHPDYESVFNVAESIEKE